MTYQMDGGWGQKYRLKEVNGILVVQGVTAKGRTKNCDNAPIHSTDENTERELGGKPPSGSAHAQVFLSPVPSSHS